MFVERLTYGNAIKQIYIPDNGYTIFYRYIYDSSSWSDWKQIFPDYSSLSLVINGYIVFANGLIIQWMNIIIDAEIGEEISQDDTWTQYRYYYNFNFPNNTFSNSLQLTGMNWNGFDQSKLLFNTQHSKSYYSVYIPTSFILSGTVPKQMWCNIITIGN